MTKQFTQIAVLTVIPKELAAARAALSISDSARHKDNDGTIYYSGVVQSRLRKPNYGVVLTCIGGAGNSGAAAATAEVIAKYRPRAILLMGIAAGIRGKVKIGEVVISERIVANEPAAAIRASDGTSIEEPRPEMYRWSHSMNQDVVHYQPDAQRIEQLFKQINGKFLTPPPEKEKEYYDNVAGAISVKISTIASGEKLLRDPSKLHRMRERTHGKIEVGEMEAAGFVEACRRGNIDWLVIRGISDFGDDFKDDQFHDFASQSAAAALVDFITYGLDLGDLPSAVSPTHPNSNTERWERLAAPTTNSFDSLIDRLSSVRELLVQQPLAGAQMLSNLLATRQQWAQMQVDVDLKRAELARIDHSIRLFGETPAAIAERNRAVHFLIQACLELEQELR